MVAILMMSRKLAILALLDINVFLNKSYDVIIFVHAITNIFFTWLNPYWRCGHISKIGNSRISIREVIIKTLLQGFDKKNQWGVLSVQVQ